MEVKGPGDKLSHKQKVWLTRLQEWGAVPLSSVTSEQSRHGAKYGGTAGPTSASHVQYYNFVQITNIIQSFWLPIQSFNLTLSVLYGIDLGGIFHQFLSSSLYIISAPTKINKTSIALLNVTMPFRRTLC